VNTPASDAPGIELEDIELEGMSSSPSVLTTPLAPDVAELSK
jgi:hypothetical protein